MRLSMEPRSGEMNVFTLFSPYNHSFIIDPDTLYRIFPSD